VAADTYGKGSCALATPNCNAGASNGITVSCATAGYPGYTGSGYALVYTTYGGGGSCNQVATGSYSQGTCATCSGNASAPAVVTCAQYSSILTGSIYSTTPYVCSGTTWIAGATAFSNSCSCVNGANNPSGGCTTCSSGYNMTSGVCQIAPAAPTCAPPEVLNAEKTARIAPAITCKDTAYTSGLQCSTGPKQSWTRTCSDGHTYGPTFSCSGDPFPDPADGMN